ncbi:MAG: TonB family protein [Acidobacteria bacterium]|nr:TonB family protein [Acidobacteriota bacterium]
MFRLLFVLCPLTVWAAGISGTVFDPSGGVVPDAAVSVVQIETGSAQSAKTNAQGDFSVSGLGAGRYQLEVRSLGFALFRQVVDAGEATRVFPVLQLGAVRETVDVTVDLQQPAPAGPRRVRVGGNVQAARLLAAAKPQYPESARARGAQGTILLQAVMLTDGSLDGLRVLSAPDAELAEAAMDAVKQWRYRPTLLNGQPVEVVTTIAINYQPARP